MNFLLSDGAFDASLFESMSLLLQDKEPFFKAFDISVLQFGSIMKKNEFLVEWDSQINSETTFRDNFCPAKVALDFKRSNVVLFFFVGTRLFKAQVAFTLIDHKMTIEKGVFTTIILSSTRNSLLWVAKEGTLRRDLKNPFSVNIRDWVRATKISPIGDSINQMPTSQLMTPPNEEFANWSSWRMQMSSKNDLIPRNQFKTAIETLINYRLAEHSLKPRINPISNTTLSDFSIQLPLDITFNRLYLIECLVSNNLINRYQVNYEFFKLIQKPSRHTLERVVEKLWVKNQFISDPISTFREELDRPTLYQKQKINPASHALVRKVIIAPTKFYLLPPIIEESNRILRHYHEIQDRFIRVTFCDEGFNPIHANFDVNYKLLKRVQDVMFFGFRVACRHYNFLAFSSSQLKEHSCWFFSDGKGCSGDSIRSWMGNFSDIKIVAKHAARMGQCFSSSRDGATIGKSGFKLIRDVKHQSNLFTDGVGKISGKKMLEIARELELNAVPSAIQFRMGGFKGVLSVWPDLPPLPIYLRTSQEKFDSEHSILEVIRIASFNAAHLNRQIIILLSTLGVPDSVFHELQNDMLLNISKMKLDPTVAIPTLSQLSDEFGSSKELIKLIKSGFFKSSDRFVENCLDVHFAYANNELKNRARIQVPKGALLIGVADETGILEPNEIFVQYSDPASLYKTMRPLGECIVTRNPCFHPGDIRVVTAVDVPQLHHLVNCVVFSIKQDPSNPNNPSIPGMCSGGDLDGDDFTVIWDSRLIPPVRNFPPMKHLPATPIPKEKVNVSDIKSFFGDYIMNDNLGQIANAHLALSDKSLNGAQDEKCLKLAQLHSRAVDFTKTGIRAEFTSDLRPNKFPDFMLKDPKRSYKSEKILGQLFRSLDYVRVNPTEASQPDISLHVPGFEADLAEACNLKEEYDEALHSLMDQYGVENELEIVTGCILKHREMVCKRKFEARRIISQAYHAIKNDFLRKFNDEFKNSTLSKSVLAERMRRKAYAWYFAAYTPTVVESGLVLESFGWIAKDHLIPIKLRATHGALENIQPNDPAFELAAHISRHDSISVSRNLSGYPQPISVDNLENFFADLSTS